MLPVEVILISFEAGFCSAESLAESLDTNKYCSMCSCTEFLNHTKATIIQCTLIPTELQLRNNEEEDEEKVKKKEKELKFFSSFSFFLPSFLPFLIQLAVCPLHNIVMLRVLLSRPVLSSVARGPCLAVSSSSRCLSSLGQNSQGDSQANPSGATHSNNEKKPGEGEGNFTHFGFSQVHEHEKESLGQSLPIKSSPNLFTRTLECPLCWWHSACEKCRVLKLDLLGFDFL